MADVYVLKCAGCGYRFEARYGCYRDSYKEDMKYKKKLDIGKGEPNIQRVYDALKVTVDDYERKQEDVIIESCSKGDSFNEEEASVLLRAPVVWVRSHLYLCESCKRFFNHKRVHMSTDKGEYLQNYVKCKYCHKPGAIPIDQREMNPPEKCAVECPRCSRQLSVKDRIIID